MLTTENSLIIKSINDELTKLFVDVVSVITKDIKGWQEEYIFKKDNEIWAQKGSNKGHAILMEEEIWREVKDKKEIDIRKLDLSALFKLMEYRLFYCKKDEPNHEIVKDFKRSNSFMKLIRFLRDYVRNLSAHSSLDVQEKVFADNNLIYKNLSKVKDYLENASCDCEGYLIKGSDVKCIFEEFIEKQWNPILEAYYKAKIGIDIDYQSDKDILIEDLASYNIIVDYTVFFQDDEYSYVNVTNLVTIGKTIFAEQSLLEGLKNTQIQGNSDDKIRANKIIKTLETWAESGKLILLETASVVDKLSQARDAKWCVLTMDPILANDVWNIQKKNVIAVKPKSRKTYEIFRIDMEKISSSTTPNGKFQVEIASGSGGARLEETICVAEHEANVLSQYRQESIVQTEEIVEQYTGDILDPPGTGVQVYVGDPKQDCTLWLEKLLREGGEGMIYEFYETQNDYAKIYKADQLTQPRVKKLEKMVEYKDRVPKEVCWPKNILCHPQRKKEKYIVGYIMPKAGGVDKQVLGTIREVIIRIAKGEYKWERKDLVLLCYNCSLLFESLHKSKIWMGDVNPDNIMVDEDKKVYFIDTDSYQFQEFCCPVGTIEFSSPELLESMEKEHLGYANVCRREEDEYFAIAVLYFYILFLSELPYKIDTNTNAKECILKQKFRFTEAKDSKRNYIWKNLTEKLQEMFQNNFTKTNKRYSDNEWNKALNGMIEGIEAGKLSNEIFPFSAIEKEDEVWEDLECTRCHISYKMARVPGSPIQSHEKECPKCKIIKKMMQKRIYRLRCSECGELWTINEWDINGRNIEELKCPDCDDDFYFSNKNEFEEKGVDEERFGKEVERRMSFAFKMYKEELN